MGAYLSLLPPFTWSPLAANAPAVLIGRSLRSLGHLESQLLIFGNSRSRLAA